MLLVIVDFVFPLFDFMHQLGCSASSVEFEIESYLNLSVAKLSSSWPVLQDLAGLLKGHVDFIYTHYIIYIIVPITYSQLHCQTLYLLT